MTDHVGTVEVTPIDSNGTLRPTTKGVKIGWQKSPLQNAFAGDRQIGFGFGEDAPPDFVQSFAKAMEMTEFEPMLEPNAPRLHLKDTKALWSAAIRSYLTFAPLKVTRDNIGRVYSRTTAKETTHYRQAAPTLYHYTLAQYVVPFEDDLIPHYTPDAYSCEYVNTDQPRVTEYVSPFTVPGWRYQVMTHLLMCELGPHLRTSEMLNPNAVWRRLWKYFDEVHHHYGHWRAMGDRHRQRERAAFLLAIYERTLHQLDQQWHNTPSYRAAISERPSRCASSLDPILYLNISLSPSTPQSERKPLTLEEAQKIRADAYNDLLFSTLAYCHATLRTLE